MSPGNLWFHLPKHGPNWTNYPCLNEGPVSPNGSALGPNGSAISTGSSRDRQKSLDNWVFRHFSGKEVHHLLQYLFDIGTVWYCIIQGEYYCYYYMLLLYLIITFYYYSNYCYCCLNLKENHHSTLLLVGLNPDSHNNFLVHVHPKTRDIHFKSSPQKSHTFPIVDQELLYSRRS